MAKSGLTRTDLRPGFLAAGHMSVLLLLGCLLAPLDAIATTGMPVVNIRDLSTYWKFSNSDARTGGKNIIRIRSKGLNYHVRRDGCVGLTFIIEANGRPSNIQVVNSYPNDKLVQRHMELTEQYRFVPAPGNPDRQPVFVYGVKTTPGVPPEAAAANPELLEMENKLASVCTRGLQSHIEKLRDPGP